MTQAPAAGRTAGLRRALRRRCPSCGARLFETWFRIAPRCPGCGLLTDRGEHDYFLGALLLNLVLSEVGPVIAVVVAVVATWPHPPWEALLWGGLALAAAAPFVGYPYSKTLWLYADMQFRRPVFGPPAPERGPTVPEGGS